MTATCEYPTHFRILCQTRTASHAQLLHFFAGNLNSTKKLCLWCNRRIPTTRKSAVWSSKINPGFSFLSRNVALYFSLREMLGFRQIRFPNNETGKYGDGFRLYLKKATSSHSHMSKYLPYIKCVHEYFAYHSTDWEGFHVYIATGMSEYQRQANEVWWAKYVDSWQSLEKRGKGWT